MSKKNSLFEVISKKDLEFYQSLGMYEVVDMANQIQTDLEKAFYVPPPPINIWTPQEGAQKHIQKAILDDYIEEIAIHGSRGGGKTYAVMCSLLQRINKYNEYCNIVYARHTAKELKDLKRDFRLICKQKNILFTGGGEHSNTINFRNGASLTFTYLNTDGVISAQGGNISDYVIEEAANIPKLQEHLGKLKSTSRSNIPTKIILIYNYNGISYPYLKAKYNSLGHFKVKDNGGRGIISIKSLMDENKIMLSLNKNYKNKFDDINDSLRRAWLDGDEDAPVGGIAFDTLTKKNNGVNYKNQDGSYFDIRMRNFPYIIGLDWGFSNDYAVAVFIAIDLQNGRYILFDEIVEKRATPLEFAQLIKNKIKLYGKERCLIKIADTNIGRKENSENTTRHQFLNAGLRFQNPHKDRSNGYLFLYSLIKQKRFLAMVYNREDQMMGMTTDYFWNSVPNLLLSEQGSADIAQHPKQEDNGYDAIRYVLYTFHKNRYFYKDWFNQFDNSLIG